MKKLNLGFHLTALAVLTLCFAGCGDDDEDPNAVISFAESSYELAENASEPLIVTVTVSAAWPDEIVIPLSFSGTAIEGVDYQAVAEKSITISAGSSSGSLAITPTNNNSVDGVRDITITLQSPGINGLTLGEPTETIISLTNKDEAGTLLVDFAESSYTTNEFDEDTVRVAINLSATSVEEETFSVTVGGNAESGVNYTAFTSDISIPAGETTGFIEVPVLNSASYGESSNITLTLSSPENSVFNLGANASTTITIINPIANTTLFAPSEDFERLYGYNTFEEGVAVPETGRQNSDPMEGVIFDEFFAFVYYPAEEGSNPNTDPNVFGFQSDLWTEEDFTVNTNIFNIIEIYGADDNPGTIDAGISNGSAGLVLPEAIRLIPDAEGATSGRAVIIADEITVYYADETDDGITNPESFTLGLSGEGTYDEVAGEIEIAITFDATAIGDGIKTLNYIFEAARRD